MAKHHTPGPWRATQDSRGWMIETDRIMITMLRHSSSDPVEADARLIAAAPDLLVALQEAELVLAEKMRRLDADPEVSPTIHRIRAAIAKARGEV